MYAEQLTSDRRHCEADGDYLEVYHQNGNIVVKKHCRKDRMPVVIFCPSETVHQHMKRKLLDAREVNELFVSGREDSANR